MEPQDIVHGQLLVNYESFSYSPGESWNRSYKSSSDNHTDHSGIGNHPQVSPYGILPGKKRQITTV